MRFNPDAPHAQVFGIGGVYWQQNGRYYTRDGALVEGDPEREREVRELRTKLAEPTLEPEVREALRDRLAAIQAVPEPVVAVAAPEPQPTPAPDDSKALRALMEQYGEDWKGPAHARRFLEGKA